MAQSMKKTVLLSLGAVVIGSSTIFGFSSQASAVASEPWIHPTSATATQPVLMAQNSNSAVVGKIVQQLGKSSRFKVRKVAVASGYALASWIDGEAGGQALLQKQSGAWKILAHGGGWFGLVGLKQNGIPSAISERLLAQIDPK